MSQGTKRNVTNVIASLLGYAVPLLVNFASTPYLMRSLGEDAFGIQVLVNVVIGYLALMDLGIGLPLIKYLAEDKAKGDMKSASELLSTTLVLYIGLGLAGMLVAMVASDYLANNFFSIPDHFRDESKTVFQLAAVGFFATLLMGWGRSVAMGLQRYEVAYAISALSSVLGVGVGLYLIHTGFGVVGYVFSKVLFLFVAA
ncbi:MAG: oligosaccharide flippase family protein, partial [Ghiorsea sp.]|nr:oligosaccharide flippase family protein [Ghiorsea sp.]